MNINRLTITYIHIELIFQVSYTQQLYKKVQEDEEHTVLPKKSFYNGHYFMDVQYCLGTPKFYNVGACSHDKDMFEDKILYVDKPGIWQGLLKCK